MVSDYGLKPDRSAMRPMFAIQISAFQLRIIFSALNVIFYRFEFIRTKNLEALYANELFGITLCLTSPGCRE